MGRQKHHEQSAEVPHPILGGFVPFAVLWGEGAPDSPAALFPSEVSARWFIRTRREQLLAAEAIAIHLKRMLVHPARFEAVVRQDALDAARKSVEHDQHG